jgi:hypothetical protein
MQIDLREKVGLKTYLITSSDANYVISAALDQVKHLALSSDELGLRV